ACFRFSCPINKVRLHAKCLCKNMDNNTVIGIVGCFERNSWRFVKHVRVKKTNIQKAKLSIARKTKCELWKTLKNIISLLAINKRNMDICKLFVKRAIGEKTLKIKYHVKNL